MERYAKYIKSEKTFSEIPIKWANLKNKVPMYAPEVVCLITIGVLDIDDNMSTVIRSYVLCTNNQMAKDMYIANIYDIVAKINLNRKEKDVRLCVTYSNIVVRNEGGIYSTMIRNPQLVFYDLPYEDRLYSSMKVKEPILVHSMMPYTTNWDEMKKYHSLPNRTNLKPFQEYMDSGHDLKFYSAHPDFKVKAEMWKVLFGVKIGNYEEMKNTK